jgi:hypothetical protein
MEREYHRCHFCGGDVHEERVTVDYRWWGYSRVRQLSTGRSGIRRK